MLNIVLKSCDQVLLNTRLAETVLKASADVWQAGEQLGNAPAAERIGLFGLTLGFDMIKLGDLFFLYYRRMKPQPFWMFPYIHHVQKACNPSFSTLSLP